MRTCFFTSRPYPTGRAGSHQSAAVQVRPSRRIREAVATAPICDQAGSLRRAVSSAYTALRERDAERLRSKMTTDTGRTGKEQVPPDRRSWRTQLTKIQRTTAREVVRRHAANVRTRSTTWGHWFEP